MRIRTSFLVLGDSKTGCSSIRSVRSALEGVSLLINVFSLSLEGVGLAGTLAAWTEGGLEIGKIEEGILD